MDSLIVLAVPWSSLPIIWKLSCVVVWTVLQLWLCIGKGSFRCSLNLSQKVLEVSPVYSSSHVRSPHWNQYMAPLLFSMGSLSLGGNKEVFDGAIALEVGLYAKLTVDLFNVLAQTLGVGYGNMTLWF